MSTIYLSTSSRQLDLQIGNRTVPCLVRWKPGSKNPPWITSIHYRPRSRGRFWRELPPRFRRVWVTLARQALEQLWSPKDRLRGLK